MEFWFMPILAKVVIGCLLFYSKIYISLKYQRDDSNDYIALDVYMFGKLVKYSMKVPVEIDSIENPFLIDSKIETNQSKDRTHTNREKRFIKKMVHFYIKHPRRLRRMVREFRHYIDIWSRNG